MKEKRRVKRTERIQLAVTEKEKEIAEDLAYKNGLTLSEYVRKLLDRELTRMAGNNSQ